MTQNELAALITTVIKENTRKSKAAHLAICKAMLLSDGFENYLDTALDLALGLLYKRAYEALHPPSSAELDARAAKRRAARAKEARTVDVIKGVIAGNMLEHVTLNGKPFGDCTGAECRDLGGYYEYVGQEVGSDERVRDKFTEEDLQSIARDTLFPDASSPLSEDRPTA